MNQSQILIAEMSDADGIQTCVKTQGALFRTGDAYLLSINPRYFQT